jgi:GNAT superfamily N-acetyltransferase
MSADPSPAAVTVARVERDAILGLRERVLSGTRQVRLLSGDMAPTTRHWAASSGGVVVGCASVMRLRGWALRGMAVSSRCQRQGIGAQLLRVVCTDVGASMWCNARMGAVPFYSHMGWVEVSPVFNLQGQPHQRMVCHA